MKLTYRAANGRIVIETEAASEKAAFETVAGLEEVFEETACGIPTCRSQNVRHDVRVAGGFRFFHLRCCECGARLDFGQHRDTETVFAVRKDDAGAPKPNRGWYHYRPEGEAPPPSRPSAASAALTAAAGDYESRAAAKPAAPTPKTVPGALYPVGASEKPAAQPPADGSQFASHPVARTAYAAIAAAKHAGSLQTVGQRIGDDLAAGRIPACDKPGLTAAYRERMAKLSGRRPPAEIPVSRGAEF